jgi:hypothetical protein
MTQLIDLKALTKGLVGLADIFSRLTKSIEDSIKSGLRSADVVRQTRERRRLRNLMKITAHLFVHQSAFTSALDQFLNVAVDERGTWETAKFEILEIRRLLDQLDKYVLPYSDALMVRYRRQYLELLTGLGQRRQLLEAVYQLEYEEALRNRAKLAGIGKAYVGLQNSLRDMMHALSSGDADGRTIFDAVGTASGPLEPMKKSGRSAQKTAIRRSGRATSSPKQPLQPSASRSKTKRFPSRLKRSR